MLQIENEFGSFGPDNFYPIILKQMWENTGKIEVPYYTADGAGNLKAGHVEGAAIGLNPGVNSL